MADDDMQDLVYELNYESAKIAKEAIAEFKKEFPEHAHVAKFVAGAMEQVITAANLGGEIKNAGKVVLYIQFETGKSTIKQESVKTIEEMGKARNADKTLKVYIVGHTDNVGALDANMKLSEDRANAVVKMLTTYKVATTQLIGKGVGPLSPMANNKSEDGRKLNRRVEMVKQQWSSRTIWCKA